MKIRQRLTVTAAPAARLDRTRLHDAPRGHLMPILALLGAGLAGSARGQAVTEFPITTTDPSGITAGPDGNLWFTEQQAGKIGRLTPAGVITEFTMPAPDGGPRAIAAGSDGNLWFTEYKANQIGRISPAGAVAEFPIPTAGSHPDAITAGADGNLWFTEISSHKIARITAAGVVTEFAVPQATSGLGGIAAGPDGNIWFTYSVHVQNLTFHAFVGRMTTAGAITGTFSIGTGPVLFGRSIATGPDGNLWFSKSTGNQLGRITTAGVITEFSAANSNSAHLCAGPDGNVWFTESLSDRIGQITPGGVVSDFPIPTAGSVPAGIVAGSDGNLWFTESARNKIGQITTAGDATEFPIPVVDTSPLGITAGPRRQPLVRATRRQQHRADHHQPASSPSSRFPRQAADQSASQRARTATSGSRRWVPTRSDGSRRPASSPSSRSPRPAVPSWHRGRSGRQPVVHRVG